ncbi:hypothetical protein LCGC14_1793010 [marine sediment metagenome]|uniref:HNH nuclease domain-containing protein n=1 Tax=marine sediment metagenome TaxID=412755 RepID=A0A0F9HEL7_9ZZZZ
MSAMFKSNQTSWKKGNIPWNKGRKSKLSGENHYNWQGGKTEENKRIRNSFEYKEWRKAVFERDDYTCVLCWVRGGHIEADHIKSFSQYPELRLELSNGRTLCQPCHRKTDNFKGRAKGRKSGRTLVYKN